MYIVYYKTRHEAKTAYSQNTIKALKTYMYIIIKAHAVQFIMHPVLGTRQR